MTYYIAPIYRMDSHEYLKTKSSWRVDAPFEWGSVEPISFKCAALIVEGKLQAVIEIDEWVYSIKNGAWLANFCKISEEVLPLSNSFGKLPLSDMSWLSEYQKEAVEESLAHQEAKCRPEAYKALSLEDAVEAVRAYYGVDADQVQLSIHSKRPARADKPVSAAQQGQA